MDKLQNQTPVHHLGEDLIIEILLRLPTKSILCFRAVCKSWHRIITDPTFLATRGHRQPVEVLLFTTLPEPVNSRCDADIALETIDKAGSGRRLVRYPKTVRPQVTTPVSRLRHFYKEDHYLLLGSCNGLLLFKRNTGYYLICNPATRQWADLPKLTAKQCIFDAESGFYLHQPSGEYRLMCHCNAGRNGAVYYILSTNAASPRQVNVKAAPYPRSRPVSYFAHATLRGRLHWLDHPEAGSMTGIMVAFDTVAEIFQLMLAPPTTSKNVKLFSMDGLLMAADFMGVCFDLWVLEEYDMERWEHRHRVLVPWRSGLGTEKCLLSVNAVGSDEEGDVILSSTFAVVVYNLKNKTVRIINTMPNDTNVSCHVFQESLMHHTFFEAQPASPGLPFLRFSA